MIMISINFILSFTNFCVTARYFLTKMLTLGILFSIAVRAAVVANLVILDFSFLAPFILASRVVLVPRLVISDTLSSIFLILSLYTFF